MARLIIRVLITAIGLYVATLLIDDIRVDSDGILIWAAIALGLINASGAPAYHPPDPAGHRADPRGLPAGDQRRHAAPRRLAGVRLPCGGLLQRPCSAPSSSAWSVGQRSPSSSQGARLRSTGASRRPRAGCPRSGVERPFQAGSRERGASPPSIEPLEGALSQSDQALRRRRWISASATATKKNRTKKRIRRGSLK